MAKIGRPGLPSQRRQHVWEMCRVGSSISEISREVGSPPGSIFSILLPYGGIYQHPQRRRPGTLTLAEREELSRGLAAGESYRAIGRRLGRSASTISREVVKNKGPRRYRAVDADDRAWRRARRPKRCLLARRPALREVVSEKLREDWSPQQISGWLAKQHSAGSEMRVSHETIYKTLFIQSRGVLAKDRSSICVRGARSGAACTTPSQVSGAPRSPTPSRSANAPPRSLTAARSATGNLNVVVKQRLGL